MSSKRLSRLLLVVLSVVLTLRGFAYLFDTATFRRATNKEHVSSVQGKIDWAIDYVIPWSGEPTDDISGTNRDDGVIKYHIRSVLKHLVWIRRIYIFADEMRAPSWLQEFGTSVKLVNRCEVFIGTSKNCPTENSMAVSANIHRIPGLAERYIVCDDDIVITSPLNVAHFFNRSKVIINLKGKSEIYPITSADTDRTKYTSELIMNDAGVYESRRTLLPKRLPKQMLSRKHSPWPCIRSLMFQMQSEYQEWFEFVSSHKTRFCFEADEQKLQEAGETQNRHGACYMEDPQHAIMWYLNLRGVVQPVLQEQYLLRAEVVKHGDVSARRLKEQLENSAGSLNINDSVFMKISSLHENRNKTLLLESYRKRKEYILGVLGTFYPHTNTSTM